MERKQYSIEEVENCRTNAGLTKKQFAEFIKMSYNSLCVFYMGKKKVSPRLTELIRVKCSDDYIRNYQEEILALRRSR